MKDLQVALNVRNDVPRINSLPNAKDVGHELYCSSGMLIHYVGTSALDRKGKFQVQTRLVIGDRTSSTSAGSDMGGSVGRTHMDGDESSKTHFQSIT